MVQFTKFPHLERIAHRECRNITVGTCHIFPKLDGTNASVWWGDGAIQCGSRNRALTEERDNAGFWKWVHGTSVQAANLRDFFAREENQHLVVYGEWLVPHNIKTYEDEVWKRFWVFDVFDTVGHRFMEFDAYEPILRHQDTIHPLAIIHNPSTNEIQSCVDSNTYLVKEGEGLGEGVVVKNYQWNNDFGRQCWGKVVRHDFNNRPVKPGHATTSGAAQTEEEFAQKYCTPHFVQKVRAKVVNELANNVGFELNVGNQFEFEQDHKGKIIPQLLGRTFHELIQEETWNAIRKFKMPVIDFSKLQGMVSGLTKQHAESLFTGMPSAGNTQEGSLVLADHE